MGFISSIIIDGLIITSALAGIRRATGWNAYKAVEHRITNPTARFLTRKYLETGEWILDKGSEFLRKTSAKEHIKKKD